MNFKKTKIIATSTVGLALLFMVQHFAMAATAGLQYKLLESFPGFFAADSVMTDFPAMILAIYKFGIWTVGIAGLFMLVIGGFMYMASAGNTSTAGSAKGIIWDSLLGIVAALAAYLVLYVINPDLTKINIAFSPVDITATEGTPMGPAGQCRALSDGDCSVANLTAENTTSNPDWAKQASAICNGESNGNTLAVSAVDRCKGNGGNDPVSVGLFQINLSIHKIGNLDCPSAFSEKYTSASVGSRCYVTNRSIYSQCVAAATLIPANNIDAALEIYKKGSTYRNSWHPWGANARSNCNFQ